MSSIKSLFPQTLKNFYHILQSLVYNMYYGFPSRKLKVIGITGTDGKTTTANLIYHILKSNNYKVALLSTISAKIGNNELDTGFHVTSPDPWDVPKYLKMMVDEGMEWVVLETTSHGLHQNRFWGVNFEKAAFTNITHEHLDYHKDWEHYALSKMKLIDKVKKGGIAVINKDDKDSYEFIAKYLRVYRSDLNTKEYSLKELNNIDMSFEGSQFTYKKMNFELKITGEYNISNAMAAIKITEDMVDLTNISNALKTFDSLNGRMEVLQAKPFKVIVDFAHTPNALKRVLSTLNSIRKKGRIIVVFGCAGLRDQRKRGMMGEIAGKYADVILVTAEDPRTESLAVINDAIVEGVQKTKPKAEAIKVNDASKVKDLELPLYRFDEMSIRSREEAIKLAIRIAKQDDFVIITGKGHEQSLCFNTKEYPWSDHEVVKKIINKK